MRIFTIYIFVFFVCAINTYAQTGIGTTTPDASAKLDVSSNNKGFLPPRVTLTSSSDRSTISSPATGLLVYNTGNNNGLAAGYYYWNGAVWTTIATAGGSGSVAAEFGTEILTNSVAIPSAVPVDIVSFTLPSAGTWEVIYFLRAQGIAGFAAEFGLFDPTETKVPNSEILAAFGEQASTGTGVIRITTTGAAIYKLKAWASYGTCGVYSEYNGRTGVTWKKISGNSPMTVTNYGDVKTGFQTSDHNGWVKLDGRTRSTLSSTQQAQATLYLGAGTNLPDASNAVLMQSSGTLGSITGSMSTTLAQNQLPNISPSITVNNTVATMQDAGSHDHPVNVVPNSTGGFAAGNPFAFKTGMAPSPMNETYSDITDRGNSASLITTGIIGSAGNHSHTINSHGHTASSSSINGGVTQQAIDITPRRMIVNTFIYLGY
jgi:hypothetical protein